MKSMIIALPIILWGLWGIFEKKLTQHVHPVIASVYIFIASLIMLPIYIYLIRHYQLKLYLDKSGAFWAIAAALATSIASIIFLFIISKNQAYWSVAVVSVYPVITTIIGVLLLKEQINMYGIVGILLVSIGLIFLNINR